MSISGGNNNTKVNTNKNKYSTDYYDAATSLIPSQQKLAQTYYNSENNIQAKKGELGENLINDMPTYEQIDFDSPNTQKTKSYLDNQTNRNYNPQFENELNDSARGGEFGSSYQAFRRGTINNAKANELDDNNLKALSTAQNIYSNNLNNASGLMNFYGSTGSGLNNIASLFGNASPAGGSTSLLGTLLGVASPLMNLFNSSGSNGSTTSSKKQKNTQTTDNSGDSSGSSDTQDLASLAQIATMFA